MMDFTREEVAMLKATYPTGTRIQLEAFDDPFVVMGTHYQVGQQGTVKEVDDAGTVHMHWDSGQRLGLIPRFDSFKKV